MKKEYCAKVLCSIIFIIILAVSNIKSQCDGGRYHDFVFPSPPTITSNIAYGSNTTAYGLPQTLRLDIYEPTGDTATIRPLIIMAHGGVFVAGSKTGSDIVPLCEDFARLGYVVASIQYRLGINYAIFSQPDTTDVVEAIIRASQDARAAVRFFRKNVTTGGNTYKIDTSAIFFAGVSAGGFMGLNLAYLDKPSEFPNYIDTIGGYGLSGGIEGNSGNPGYSSNVKAIVNISGAILDTSWIDYNDEPILNFHGNNDGTVPYGTSILVLQDIYPLMVVNGSHSIAERVNNLGITNCFETYDDQEHIPHHHDSIYYDTTFVIMRNFLKHFICNEILNCEYASNPLGINNSTVISEPINIYPNPSLNNALIEFKNLGNKNINIELFNSAGQKVKSVKNITTQYYSLNRDNLPQGIYYLNIICENSIFHEKIIFQ